jgi:ribosome-associated translation inhibitor RaiA
MQIQINAGNHLEPSEARDAWAAGLVESAMAHYADNVTRVEVHLSDENGGKGGAPIKRCVMEARVNGRPPIAVSNDAEGVDAAVNGAVHKLVRATEHALGRADKHAHEPRQLPVADTDADDFVPSTAPF